MVALSQSLAALKNALVVGNGPAGLTAALALATAGIDTILIGPAATRPDNRTTALLAGSVAALKALGVWAGAEALASPLRRMRLVDDTGRLIRAPEAAFDCADIGLDAFGYNIANADLTAALERRAAQLPNLTLVRDTVRAVACGSSTAVVTLASGRTLAASLVIGADGRQSPCRAAAGISTDERRYPQTALTLIFRHTRPHRDISTEFHTPTGPFTVVPLPGQRSSLVWVLDPATADDMAQRSDGDLAAEVERRSHSILGKIGIEPGRGLFPLSIVTAQRYGAQRIALVGEAAHVVPPIGAQGFNLGLRDAMTIGELAGDAALADEDIGSEALLAHYHERRKADIGSRSMAIDLFNRSLLSDFLPVQGARGLGIYLLGRIPPLRRAFMREGVMPSADLPRLMRDGNRSA